jgi:SAM-dependent methyltransferase
MAGDASARHPWQDWTWDESVFEGTAAHYRAGRNPYASGLADAFADALHLDGRGRLLDVGCGPGSVTLLLAPHFAQVVGVDADPGMIAEAERAADETGIDHATWRRLRAEELPGGLGTFRVVTFAQSFHWMDRPRVAAAVRGMVEPDGAVVQVDQWHRPPAELRRAGPHPRIPEEAIDELRVRWLGPDRRAGQGFRNTSPSDEDEIFQAAGFASEVDVIVPDERMLERTADEVVAWVLSTSSTAPHLFGDRLADFERDLRAVLAKASPDGRFSVPMCDNRLRIRRPR